MKLGISADAARGASVPELAEACRLRGLAAMELHADTAAAPAEGAASDNAAVSPGFNPDTCALPGCDNVAGYDVEVVGVLCGNAAVPDAQVDPYRADILRVIAGDLPLGERIAAAGALEDAGVQAAVLVSGPADDWLDAVRTARCAFVWQVDGTCREPAADAVRIFEAIGLPRYVRLLGGGPESTMHEGRGIGALMSRLTLSGYDRPLILAPSSPKYHVAWSTWLGRRGGWGCGSKAEGPLTLQRS